MEGVEEVRGSQPRIGAKNAHGLPGGRCRRHPVSKPIDQQNCDSVRKPLKGPGITTDLFPCQRQANRTTQRLVGRQGMLGRSPLYAGDKSCPRGRQRINIEQVRHPPDRSEPRSGRPGRGKSVSQTLTKIGHSGPSVESQELNPSSITNRQGSENDLASRGVLDQVGCELGSDQSNPPLVDFTEPKFRGQTNSRPADLPCPGRVISRDRNRVLLRAIYFQRITITRVPTPT
jgi:hypothetical protein